MPLEDQWGLRPDVGGAAWRIEPVEQGRLSSGALLASVDRLRAAPPERVRAEASTLGLLGPPGSRAPLSTPRSQSDWRDASWPAVARGLDLGRARELLADLQRKLGAPTRQRPTVALVDPEDLARADFNRQQAEGKIELMRDGGQSRGIADALEHYIDFERRATDHDMVSASARLVATLFVPRSGCSHLYGLIRSELREWGAAPRDALWPRIAALVLLRRAASAPALAWSGLAMLAPLLLAVVGDPPPSPPSDGPERGDVCDLEGRHCRWPIDDRHRHVRDERTLAWQQLARDIDVWLRALRALDGPIAKGTSVNPELIAALRELASLLLPDIGDVRTHFAAIDPTDRPVLWSMLSDLFDEWLEREGLAADGLPAPGALLGARAHVLLALRRTFHGRGRCRGCGQRIIGQAERCGTCKRAYDRERQRELRGRKAVQGRPHSGTRA